MLIKCPECGKEVSDKAPHCIHCGFPLSNICNGTNIVEQKEKICIVNGKPIDFTNELEILLSSKPISGSTLIRDKAGITISEAFIFYNIVSKNKRIPEVFDSSKAPEYKARLEAGIDPFIVIECPYCKSKDTEKISDAKKSRAALTGAWGTEASKVMNQWHCNTCGSDF